MCLCVAPKDHFNIIDSYKTCYSGNAKITKHSLPETSKQEEKIRQKYLALSGDKIFGLGCENFGFLDRLFMIWYFKVI